MPVIVNDLEVILEAPDSAPGQATPAPAAGAAAPGGALDPGTLARIERHRRARAARLRGH